MADLYLHEVVDIVGLGAWPYMQHTLAAAGDEKVNFELQGTFQTMGITGRWPQVVNIWDIPGGWDGWREAVGRLNLERPANAALEEWWQVAFELRSGGFDRLLVGTPGCPTTRELVSAGVRGSLFVHELSEVQPGSQQDYLAAVLEVRAPLMVDYGHVLTGAYAVAFSDFEVVTVWATDVDSHVRLQEAAGTDTRIRAWEGIARRHSTRRREELMTPCPGIPIGPEVSDG
ncbi:MAG: hypothetical protein DYH08_03440 [Actinobacteria bacterium ATB1]|nr:hypothetical protein [Actinobacteria bacterium ATB1]